MIRRLKNVYLEHTHGCDLEVMVVEEVEDAEGYPRQRYVARGYIPLNDWLTWATLRDLLREVIEENKDYGRLQPILDALEKVVPEEL